MTELIWSFSPWLTFMAVSRFGNLYVSLAIAGAVGLVVFGRSAIRKKVHMLDVASVAYFAALGAVVGAIRPSDLDTWARYAQAGSHATVTLLVFGSILVGRPFTESYARSQVSESVWHSVPFRALNRQISLVWGGAFLAGTISLVVAGANDGRQFLLRLAIPFGALFLAYLYTQKVTGEKDEQPEISAAR